MKNTIKLLLRLQQLDNSRPMKSAREETMALKERLPAAILDQYERLRGRGRKVVALITENGVCSGCHLRVSRGLLVAVDRGEEVQRCEHCGCYLVRDGGRAVDRSVPMSE